MDIGKIMEPQAPTAEFQFSDTVWLTIRYLSAPALRSLNAKARTVGWDSKHRQIDRVDSEKIAVLVGEAALIGWRGIKRHGEDVPFSPEMRDWLMSNIGDFSNFVFERAVEYSAYVDYEREESKKN